MHLSGSAPDFAVVPDIALLSGFCDRCVTAEVPTGTRSVLAACRCPAMLEVLGRKLIGRHRPCYRLGRHPERCQQDGWP
jgi:hypothetical protein